MRNINLSIKGFPFKLKLLKSSKFRKLYIFKYYTNTNMIYPKDKYIISKDDYKIYYWFKDNKSLTKPVVFLHPASSLNHTSLQHIEKWFNERGHPTLITDPRGFGYSKVDPKPENFIIELYADDISRICEKEKIINPIFFGHSFAFMPIVYYVSETENSRQIIGVCSPYNFPENSRSKNIIHFLGNKATRHLEYLGNFIMSFGHLTKGDLFEKDFMRYPDQSKLEEKNHLSEWLSYARVWFHIVDVPFRQVKSHIVSGIEITKYNIEEDLKKCKVPIYLIYGGRDTFVKPMGEYINTLTEKCKFYYEIIKEGAHSPPITHPKKVTDSIKKASLESRLTLD